MNRNTLNATVDATLAISATGLLLTGLLLAFVLPAGTNRLLTLWGLTRHDWGSVHLWLASAALAAGLVHLVLHWTWIVATVRRAFVGRGAGAPSLCLRVVAGSVTTVLLLAFVAAFWTLADAAAEARASSPGPGLRHAIAAAAEAEPAAKPQQAAFPGRTHRTKRHGATPD